MLITSIFSYFSHFQNALNFNLFEKELRGLTLSDSYNHLTSARSPCPFFMHPCPFSWSRIITRCNHYWPFFVFFNFISFVYFSVSLCYRDKSLPVPQSRCCHYSSLTPIAETKWRGSSTFF